ncbi:MAG: NDP-sugar pyrophosphorylase family protein [Granulosicoccus sp.]|jgi:NDP-sugar pyrophosphorylase family protein
MSGNTSVDKAILLAAGRGKRLKPHTDNTPKPLLAYHGKATIDYLMDSLQIAGINDVVLVTHYLGEQIEAYAQRRAMMSGQRVRCVQQQLLAGTADALQCVLSEYPEFGSDSFLLTATDYLVPKNFFSELLEFHQAHSMGLSVSLKALPESELEGRSSVRFNEDQSIGEIVEKPPAGTAPSLLAANLTFVLPGAIVPYVSQTPVSPRGEKEIQHAINSWIIAGGEARGLLQATPSEWSPD